MKLTLILVHFYIFTLFGVVRSKNKSSKHDHKKNNGKIGDKKSKNRINFQKGFASVWNALKITGGVISSIFVIQFSVIETYMTFERAMQSIKGIFESFKQKGDKKGQAMLQKYMDMIAPITPSKEEVQMMNITHSAIFDFLYQNWFFFVAIFIMLNVIVMLYICLQNSRLEYREQQENVVMIEREERKKHRKRKKK